MQMTRFKGKLSLIVCTVLIAAMALIATGCNGNKDTAGSSVPNVGSSQIEGSVASQTEGNVLGKGATRFTFTVTDAEGKETAYQINTDKKTVGDALTELGLIAGEKGPYGLYIKTVNGITVDYDKDRKYWAFYVNGSYAAKGVDSTEVQPGATYSFKVE